MADKNLAYKLEYIFLGIFRMVVLTSILLTLVGTLTFVILGLKKQYATAITFPRLEPNFEESLRDLKISLEPTPVGADDDAWRDTYFAKRELMVEELDKQVELVIRFLGSFNLVLKDPDGFRSEFHSGWFDRARQFDDFSDYSALELAADQTKFLDLAFNNPDILASFEKIKPQGNEPPGPDFDNSYRAILDYFPEYVLKELEKRSKLQEAEMKKIEFEKAESITLLYTAGAMFLGFLLISLILILIKIERNLRVIGHRSEGSTIGQQ